MPAPPLLADAFQLAYVSNDLDRAVAMIGERYGTGEFRIMRDIPDGDGSMSIALAFTGHTNIEVIQPAAGGSALYCDWIAQAEGFVVRFHHICGLIGDAAGWAAMRQRFVDSGTKIPLEGSQPGALDYLYADTVADLGHYLEYVRLYEGGRAMFADVPGFPGFDLFDRKQIASGSQLRDVSSQTKDSA